MARIEPNLPPEIFVVRRPRPLAPISPSTPSNISTSASSRRSSSRRFEGMLQRGSIVDKYRVEDLLGTGGFAAVYRATHLLLKVPVAIKLLRPDVLAKQPDVAARLVEEARWAARIQHPRVVRVFDVAQTPELTYIVMEYIDGESLSAAIERRTRLSPDEVIQIGTDVAEGLAAALDKGLVHRDVKPANILLARDGRAYLADLGLAKAEDRARGPSLPPRRLVGTRGYAAPEQIESPSTVDFRADIFSLGITLREALEGRSPNRTFKIPPGAKELAKVLHRMTAPDPGDRPASYAEVIAALRAGRPSSEDGSGSIRPPR